MRYMTNPKYPVGTIFRYDGSYWKVTGLPFMECRTTNVFEYPLIKCSKNGKEFKMKKKMWCSHLDKSNLIEYIVSYGV